MQLCAVVQAIQNLPLAAATGMAVNEEQIAHHDSTWRRIAAQSAGKELPASRGASSGLEETEEPGSAWSNFAPALKRFIWSRSTGSRLRETRSRLSSSDCRISSARLITSAGSPAT